MQSFVECYSALMGGGKSFSAVQRMCSHIAGGGVVYSNILLRLDPWFNASYPMKEFLIPICPLLERFNYIPDCKKVRDLVQNVTKPETRKNKKGFDCYVYNSAGAVYFLRKMHRWNYQEGQYNYIDDDKVGPNLPQYLPTGSVDRPVLVVLDEALDHFESESANTNAEFRSFLRHVRKLGLNLIFIAQDFGSLEKKIRVLTHYVWTFKDLKTWKVPVIGCVLPGGVLPSPWCDNIHQRQYHQKQFGMAKSEPINKKQYAFRDPLVFQCYQSVSLHNSNLTMAGVAQDFGTSGKIKRKGRKMSIYERVAIYLLIGFLGVRSFAPPDVVQVSMPAAVAKENPVKNESLDDGYLRNADGEIVELLPISWFAEGDHFKFFLEGRLVRLGDVSGRGIVEFIDTERICFRTFSGVVRWVLNSGGG